MRILLAAVAFMLFSPATAVGAVRIAAAANLNQVMPVLVRYFSEQNPKYKVSVTYGASGTLSQQIAFGAPYDVFLSASPDYVDYLVSKGLVVERAPFARGRLVLYFSKRLTPPLASPADLERRDVFRIVIANPQHAPYGRAAASCLRQLGLYEDLEGKLTYAANVSQAAQMALQSGAAAFIALPLALNEKMQAAGDYLLLPADCHQPLLQEAALLSRDAAAKAFFYFLKSRKALNILHNYGYGKP